MKNLDISASNAEIVDAVKTVCPGFDSPLLSKCRNPARYGVQLHQKAKSAVLAKWPTPPRETRSLPTRLYVRVTPDEYRDLLRYARQNGHATMQDCLRALIVNALKTPPLSFAEQLGG